MKYEKADDISYVDLKEACKIFNQHENLLGTKINTRRKGFDDLMEAFIKAIMAVPHSRWEDIPGEVMAFYNAMPAECFEAAHVATPTPAVTGDCADDGIPEFESKVCGIQDRSAAGDDVQVIPLPLRKEPKPRLVPLVEGKMKIKTMIGIMEAIRHLEYLVTALKKGSIYIISRNRIIMMKPNDPVDIKLDAGVEKEKKRRREKMAIELEWMRGIATDWNADDYSISSKGPAN
ncbi:MAG: hypothetical protein V1766_11470 [Pseudomonadota bacterium]